MKTNSQQHGELNEAQCRRLAVTCSYIDKLLSEVEEVLHETSSKSPFPRHVIDLTPSQTRVIEDHNFLKQLAGAGLSELTRMPHALDPEKGFRVRSSFVFEKFIGTAEPPSPLRWLADVFLPLLGGRKMITNDAREFLRHLLETNSARVQNDVLNRIQESRDRLEVEIRKLLHEVSRIAEQALGRARKVKEEGTPAVQAALERLDRLEMDVSALLQ